MTDKIQVKLFTCVGALFTAYLFTLFTLFTMGSPGTICQPRYGQGLCTCTRPVVPHPGLRSQRISSDSNSDSGLTISTPTPTPLRLRPNKCYSILKKQCDEDIFCIVTLLAPKRVTGNTAPVRDNCGCNQPWLSHIP